MRRRAAGFTLVEVAIAAALFSLIMLGLLAALRGMGQASERATEHIQRIDDMRLISDVLRNLLGQAQLLSATEEGGSPLPPLSGAAQEIIWIAPMPAYHGTGGLHLFRLAQTQADGATPLILQYVPYTQPLTLPDWSAAESYRLLETTQSVAFAYQGAEGEEWLTEWVDPQLPARVRLRIAERERHWPELVAPIYGYAP